MRKGLIPFGFVVTLLLSFQTMAQYGYGGGYGGYGRGYGSSMNQLPSTPRKPLTSDQIAEEQTKWMNKKLKLTEDQSISVETLNLDYALRLMDFQEAFMKIHANTRPTPQEIQQIRTTVDKWEAEKEAKFQTILTPEQWEIYQKKKKGMPHTNNK
jgi:hypothetical protein